MLDKNFELSDGSTLFPPNLKEEINLKRESEDVTSNKDHIFFDQKIDGIRIVGGELAVHIKGGNKIYALTGKILSDKSYAQPKISDEKARELAVQQARAELENETEFTVTVHPKAIVNLKLLGLSDDETNYYTAPVQIDSNSSIFSKIY